MTTRRGINLGCGSIILPCERPQHHQLIPAELYAADSGIAWDNCDWNGLDGVNLVVDLFDYPWRKNAGSVRTWSSGSGFGGEFSLEGGPEELPDNTYDVAIGAHIAEHIPHHIVWQGQFVHRHPDYQDGWFAWFGELWRIMKPGGKAYILSPYAWSNGGISDPTHTRYLTPASFNYFNNATDDAPAFRYRMHQRWNVRLDILPISPHVLGVQRLAAMGEVDYNAIWNLAQSNLNAIADFMIELEAVKD